MSNWIKIKDNGFQEVVINLDYAIGIDFNPTQKTNDMELIGMILTSTSYTFQFKKDNPILGTLKKYFEDKLNAKI